MRILDVGDGSASGLDMGLPISSVWYPILDFGIEMAGEDLRVIKEVKKAYLGTWISGDANGAEPNSFRLASPSLWRMNSTNETHLLLFLSSLVLDPVVERVSCSFEFGFVILSMGAAHFANLHGSFIVVDNCDKKVRNMKSLLTLIDDNMTSNAPTPPTERCPLQFAVTKGVQL